MSSFQVSHNPTFEESKLVGFVLNLNPLVIKISPKRSTQHFLETVLENQAKGMQVGKGQEGRMFATFQQ